MEKPTQRHQYCKIEHCQTCLDDCWDLQKYLSEQSEIDTIDHLGAYRTWFDKQGINTESEFGWPLPMVFDADNIGAYLERYK